MVYSFKLQIAPTWLSWVTDVTILQSDWTGLLFSCLRYFFPHLFSSSSSVSLSYLNLAVPMRGSLGKHSCMSSPFPIAILNGTCSLRAPILFCIVVTCLLSKTKLKTNWCDWTRQSDRTGFIFFVSIVLLSTFILLLLLSSSVSLSYFNLTVPTCKCLGKHSCMSSPFSIVVLVTEWNLFSWGTNTLLWWCACCKKN